MIFAVIAVTKPELIKAAVQKVYGENHFPLTEDQWLVVDAGTAREVSDKLGITPKEDLGSALVLSVSGYYGRKGQDLWEWMKAKMTQASNG